MREYKSDMIRNVVLAAHGGVGKTSIADALLFNAGANNRQGRVDDGSSVLDFDEEEKKRKVTISASLAPCEWKENKINLLDTPGYSDFVAEVISSLRAAEGSVIVVCAASGVEVQTEKTWNYSQDLGLAKIAFINKMDRENANFMQVVREMREKFGGIITPIQIPIGSEANFTGIIDLLSMKAIIPANIQGTQFNVTDIPEELLKDAEEARINLMEAAAEGDSKLLDKYLDGIELTDEEICMGFVKAVHEAKVTPVMCGSALKNIGMHQLLDAILTFIPAPTSRTVIGYNPKDTEDLIERSCQDKFSALVFKTTADPFVGRLNFLRIFSGQLKLDSTIYNVTRNKMERISHIFTLRGKTQDMLTVANAGDIVVIPKLQECYTSDTLADKTEPILFENIFFPKPMFTRAIEPKKKGDEDKIGIALHRLADEDKTFIMYKNTETKQTLISGIGELHLDIAIERMKKKFGVEVKTIDPKVAYRETIRSSVKVEGKHKKQSGGRGQYGHVWLQLDPKPAGEGVEFAEKIFGGSVPHNFIPAVEKGAKETLIHGIIAGYPVVDIKVTLFDGSYHDVDSSEIAFKIATSAALKKGVLQAKPVLLEPVCNVTIKVPEGNMGDVMGDLNSKRGRPQGMEPIGKGLGIVKAQVPLAEMFRYSIDLRSMTQGRGTFDMNFSHYEEVPQRISDNIIADYQKHVKED